MHARLDRYHRQPGHRVDSPDLADLSSGVAGQPGLLSCLTFRQLGGPATVRLTLWDTEASATGCPAPDAGLTPPAAGVYQITDTEEGPAAAQAPAYARLVCFDGPRAPEQAAAEDLAGRQRIWPAIHGLSGLVSIYVLRGSDLGSIVVTLATSVETLDAAQRAVMATELTPGEDAALLPGPDRVEIHRVTGHHLPAVRLRPPATVPGTSGRRAPGATAPAKEGRLCMRAEGAGQYSCSRRC